MEINSRTLDNKMKVFKSVSLLLQGRYKMITVYALTAGQIESSAFTFTPGTFVYVVGSGECQSKLTEEMLIPLRPIPKEDTVRG